MGNYDICVVGGCGHVGLPLAIAFANKDLQVAIYDINENSVNMVNNGVMPFLEPGADDLLKQVLNNSLHVTNQPEVISESKFVIIVIGTPVDEYLNPSLGILQKFISDYFNQFKNGQTLILRSTLYPGTTEWLHNYFKNKNKKINVSFCPERIAESKAMIELLELPQIISAFDKKTLKLVEELFLKLTNHCIIIDPVQAELAKLFTNSWRYIQFAVANQFFMLAADYGTDFYEIYNAITYKYPRAKGFPKAGFAAGPCLFKDTMQLSSFGNNNFFLGHSAMLVNEGLPKFIVEKLKGKYSLINLNVGILGMAFKGNSDDKRSSLSYKLKKLLELEAKNVLCSDVYIRDTRFVSVNKVLEDSDIIIIGTPHSEYMELTFNEDKVVIDMWGLENTGKIGL